MGKSGKLVALIGDIDDSRRHPDRVGLQDDLLDALDEVNAGDFRAGLFKPFRITAGDEFEGLLRSPRLTTEIATFLTERLHPTRIVFGLGFGELSTPVGSESDRGVTTLDGPCFHRAREALGTAKKRGTWLDAIGFDETTDETIGAICSLIHAIRTGWTETQAKYVVAARRTNHRKDVASKFGVSPSVVTESLQAARFDAIATGERALRAQLARFGP